MRRPVMLADLHSDAHAFLDFADVPGLAVAGKNEFTLAALDRLQQLDRRLRQRHDVVGFCLVDRGGFRPDAFDQVEVGPLLRQHFAASRAGQQQQPDDVGELVVGVLGQRRGKPRQLLASQVALPPDLGIALDALGRIVGAHLPADREAEHLAAHGDDAIGGISAPVLP